MASAPVVPDPPGEFGAEGCRFLGLTNWLHAEVRSAAGRSVEDAPLTFGDLWGAPLKPGDATIKGRNVKPTRTRTIELADDRQRYQPQSDGPASVLDASRRSVSRRRCFTRSSPHRCRLE